VRYADHTCSSSPRSPNAKEELVFDDVGMFEINCEVTYSYRFSSGEPTVVCTPPSHMSTDDNCGQSTDCKRFVNKYMIVPETNTQYKCVITMKWKDMDTILRTYVSPRVRAECKIVLISLVDY